MGDILDDVTFPIAMLGARGVGKTSMIAAMRNEFDKVANIPGLQLTPEPQTRVALDATLLNLKRLGSLPTGTYVPISTKEYGITATLEPYDYDLRLHHVPSKTGFKIVYHDYPGRWLKDDPNAVHNRLARAAVILVAIDVPALMTFDDASHEEANMPTSIAGALGSALLDDNSDVTERLILFVLMRGESWLQTNQDLEIVKAFRDRFAAALKVLRDYESRVGVALLPIQTLGPIHFTHYVGEIPRFRKINGDYRPVDCDQPLRFSLLYLLKMLDRIVGKRRDRAREVIGSRSKLKQFFFQI